MAGADLHDVHAKGLGDAERLVSGAEEAAGVNDGNRAVRCARDLVAMLDGIRKAPGGAGPEARARRSQLYLRAVRAVAKTGRWEDARQLANHLRYTKDPRLPERRELAKVLREANSHLQLATQPAECDLVMKGGITSGIVYPLALFELHKQYRFRNIGGASVGAVAAGAVAAAQYSELVSKRTHATEVANQGFAGLAQLPEEMGGTDAASGQSKLLSLFRPQRETKPAMDVLLAVLGGRSAAGKALAALGAVLKAEPLPFLVSVVLAALLVWAAMGTDQALLATLSVLGAFATMALGAIGSAAILAVGLNRAISANGFGICRGQADSATGPEALTTYLTELFDRLAGLRDHPHPLTFGDLKGEGIKLVAMTTCLTFGRPYRLPFLEDLEANGQVFFFNVAEFAELFPESVSDAMQDAGERRLRKPQLVAKWGPHLRRFQAAGFLPFPDADDLPVVVAVRMSLSFPVLVSMVPLYAVDETLHEAVPRLERCWFSDGGACSNLPIHFFDALVPGRPTFAINLVGETPVEKVDPNDQSKNVWMPSNNTQGISEQWNRFGERPSLFRFFGALLNTMQNWVDGMQLTAPGYRDRIVHIRHTATEGGLNLNMDPKVIRQMSERGAAAGQKVREDFDWDNHVWIRLRSVLDISDRAMDGVRAGLLADPALRALVARLLTEHTGSTLPEANAPVTEQAAAEMRALFPQLETLLKAHGVPFSDQAAPDPTPELRVRPKL